MKPQSSWIQTTAGGVVLFVQIQPRASKTEVIGLHGTPPRLKIRVAAPPVEGEANACLVEFLAKALSLPKRSVQIQRGETGKLKQVLLLGATLHRVQETLEGAIR